MKRFFFILTLALACITANAQTTLFSASPNPSSSYYTGYSTGSCCSSSSSSSWEYYGTIYGMSYNTATGNCDTNCIPYKLYFRNMGSDCVLKATDVSFVYSVQTNPYYRQRDYGTISRYKYRFRVSDYEIIYFNL